MIHNNDARIRFTAQNASYSISYTGFGNKKLIAIFLFIFSLNNMFNDVSINNKNDVDIISTLKQKGIVLFVFFNKNILCKLR